MPEALEAAAAAVFAAMWYLTSTATTTRRVKLTEVAAQAQVLRSLRHREQGLRPLLTDPCVPAESRSAKPDLHRPVIAGLTSFGSVSETDTELTTVFFPVYGSLRFWDLKSAAVNTGQFASLCQPRCASADAVGRHLACRMDAAWLQARSQALAPATPGRGLVDTDDIGLSRLGGSTPVPCQHHSRC